MSWRALFDGIAHLSGVTGFFSSTYLLVTCKYTFPNNMQYIYIYSILHIYIYIYIYIIVHDLHLYLVSAELLCAVGETHYGKRVGFIGSTHSLFYLFIFLSVSEVQRLNLFSY